MTCLKACYSEVEPKDIYASTCPAIEMERAHLNFVREEGQTIFYEDIEVGTRRADFV
ncbi:MAG: hypothetical protein IPP04_19265 [Saprospiraceae bacterium]|nr:hypothetical protein [Saprospiraceae bacterium]MBK9931988.1 hypothetical protein [Saprospiraceae bacterium]